MTLSLLIDGNNHIARDCYACKDATQTANRFLTRLEMLHDQLKPSRMVVCWDSPGQTFRKDLFPDYKSHRGPPSDELRRSLARGRQICIEVGVDSLEVPGFEADDLIATLCTQDQKRGWKVIMSSTDKDLRQLLCDGQVNQMVAWSRVQDRFEFTWCTETTLLNKYGVSPRQWLDVQILAGDSSDGIPGAKRIGEQTALDLIKTHGSLEKLLANPWLIPGDAIRRAMFAFKPSASIMSQLCTLRRDVPLPAAWMQEVCTR